MSDLNIPDLRNKGDVCWFASYGRSQERETCPVCFGKLAVTIILGDDSAVETKCEYCSEGFGPPRGTVQTWKSGPTVERITIAGRAIEDNDGHVEVTYKFNMSGSDCCRSYRTARPDDLFDSETEAQAEANRRASEATREEFEMSLRRKHTGQTDRTNSWGVGYHRNEAKDHRRQAEYHEQACRVCKDRAKKAKGGKACGKGKVQ